MTTRIVPKRVKALPRSKEGKTGRWAYWCQRCGDPALLFPGNEPPALDTAIEHMDYLIGGRYYPRSQAKPVCGQCGVPIPLEEDNHLMIKYVMDINSFCRAKGVAMSVYGYALTPEQEEAMEKKKGFFYWKERISRKDGKKDKVPAPWPMFKPDREEKGAEDPYKEERTVVFLSDMPSEFVNEHIQAQVGDPGPYMENVEDGEEEVLSVENPDKPRR